MSTFESSGPDSLKADARRAYEWARLRYALAITWVVAPMIALCLASCSRPQACLGLSAALLLMAVGFRWYGRGLGRAVLPGVLLGSLGFALPWMMKVSGHGCNLGACSLQCVGACATLGLALGLLLSWRAARKPQPSDHWHYMTSLGIIAGMTAALGCLPLGLTGAIVALCSTSLSSFAFAALAPQPG